MHVKLPRDTSSERSARGATVSVAAVGGLIAAATPWPWGLAVATLGAGLTWFVHRATTQVAARASRETAPMLPTARATAPPAAADTRVESPLVARLEVDHAGHITAANKLAVRLLGSTPSALLGATVDRYLPGLLEVARDAKDALHRRWTLHGGAGAPVTVETAILPRDAGRFTLEVVDIGLDARALSDARAAQRDVQVALAARERLLRAYGMAVRARAGEMTELLSLVHGESVSDELESPLVHAHTASSALLAVTDDIIELTRGADPAAGDELDPLALVEQVVRTRARAAPAAASWIIAVDAAVEPALIGDAGRLRRVLDNLATHAAAVSRSGLIQVRVATPKDPRSGRPILTMTLQEVGPPRRFGDGSWTGPAAAAPGGIASLTLHAGLELYVAHALLAPLGGHISVADDPSTGPQIILRCPLLSPALAVERPGDRLDGLRVALRLSRAEEGAAIAEYLTARGAKVSRGPVTGAEPLDALVTDAAFERPPRPGGSCPAVILLGRRGFEDEVDARLTRPVAPSELIATVAELGREAQSSAAVAPPVAPTCERASRGRALLVDDDNDNQLVAARMLEDLGFGVTVASDGVRALAAARVGGFDVILMNWQLPGLNGLEVTRRLRATGGDAATVPIIALTGRATPEDIAACTTAGMNAYLAKPLTRTSLAETLAALLPRGPVRQPDTAGPERATSG